MSTSDIENFLNKLIMDNRNNTLSKEVKTKIFELFIIDELQKNSISLDSLEEDDDKNNMKYYTLGWYIYNNLITK